MVSQIIITIDRTENNLRKIKLLNKMLRNVKREIEWSMNETEADSWGEVYDALVTKLKTLYD
tara:strand:- start:50 stop:235 length:186 start_codon:yes stop_codon:yes gene_type:complete